MFPTSLDNDQNLVKHTRTFKQLYRRMMWIAKLAFPEVDTQKTEILIFAEFTHFIHFPITESISVRSIEYEQYPTASNIEILEFEIQKWGGKGRHTKAIYIFKGAYYDNKLAITSFYYWPGRERSYYFKKEIS